MFATLHAGIGVKQTHSYARSLIKERAGFWNRRARCGQTAVVYFAFFAGFFAATFFAGAFLAATFLVAILFDPFLSQSCRHVLFERNIRNF